MREFLDGDIAVCVGYENNVTGYGFHCYMWLETSGLPVVKIYSRSYTPDDEVHRVDGDEVRGSIDSPDARDHTRGRHRAIIAFVDEGSPVVLDRADFLTEDGYHIIIEDILLTRHSNTEDCVASAIISARQR
jgi:hypothetical protein